MIYYTDGYTQHRNPSPTGGGYTIVEGDNLAKTVPIKKVGLTNNEAELRGVIECLRMCEPYDEISTDSQTILSWLGSKKKCKARPDLQDLINEGKRLKIDKNVDVFWEGREFNLAGIYNETEKLDTSRPC